MIGNVFSIEEFSVYDGPGIRTTVFLKGCPLRCSWCHNPEGQKKESEYVKSPNGCIGCGNCFNGINEEIAKKCPMNLIRLCGEYFESDALCERLLKNGRILNSGGGVTFSGGEPFVQSGFLFECLEKLKGKLHTAIQTSGYCHANTFEKALNLADYFLFDIKIADEKLHKKYTGVSNKMILENFARLAKSRKAFTVRIPLIPDIIDNSDNLYAIAEILRNNDVYYVELLPYNKMAGSKYKMAFREYKPDFNENAQSEFKKEIFLQYGIKTKIM